MSFTVAIIGRPNVGKSTLFNRLVGRKLALVDDTPGVTRDRRPGEARLADLRFRVIDTAGLEESGPDTLETRMRAQTEAAIEEADLSLFIVDAKSGLTPLDQVFADILRKRGKPVVLVANKAEARAAASGFYDAFGLGLGEPCPISAEHGEGMPDLRDAIIAALGEELVFADKDRVEEAESDVDIVVQADDKSSPAQADETIEAYDETKPMRVAIVGRPNAGKSTLINRLLGQERLLTGPEAGITRDSIAVDFEWQNRKIKLFDTAGMRRKARVQEKLEKLSVGDALRAIRFAEVVVIVIDATMPFEKQDLQIADLVVREGRAPVIAFNKWDLIENRQVSSPNCMRRSSGCCHRCAAFVPSRLPADMATVWTGSWRPSSRPTRSGTSVSRPPSSTAGLINRSGAAPAAGGFGASCAAEIHDADQGAPAGFHHFLHQARSLAGFLHALSRQFLARELRHAGRADPDRSIAVATTPMRQGRRKSAPRADEEFFQGARLSMTRRR